MRRALSLVALAPFLACQPEDPAVRTQAFQPALAEDGDLAAGRYAARMGGSRGAPGVERTADLAIARAAVKAPTGRIVFSAEGAGGLHDLFAVRPDGTGLVRLTRTPDVDEVLPSWSPDQRAVAFVARSEGARRLGVLDVATRGARYVSIDAVDLADTAGGRLTGTPSRPSWSPGGDAVVVSVPVEWGSGGADALSSMVVRVDVSHSELAVVGDAPRMGGRGLFAPSWADEGTIVALYACWSSACGSHEVVFTQLGGPRRSMPATWAPGELDARRGRWTYSVRVGGSLGSQVAISTWFAAPTLVTEGRSPRWSPAADHLAFVRDDGIWIRVPEDETTEKRIHEGAVESLDW